MDNHDVGRLQEDAESKALINQYKKALGALLAEATQALTVSDYVNCLMQDVITWFEYVREDMSVNVLDYYYEGDLNELRRVRPHHYSLLPIHSING